MAKKKAKKKTEKKVSLVGRPTKYEPIFCEMLITHQEQGYSFESFGAIIGVHRDTLYEWSKRHPEFSDARKIAKERCLYYFEQIGRAAMRGEIDKFQAAIWVFSMKARFSWTDRPDTDDKDGKFKPIVIELPNAGKTLKIENENDK